MHQVLDDDPKILDDPLAVDLVEGSSRDQILAQPVEERLPEWFRSIFVLRSRFTEDSLAEAVAHGVKQYVLLGAGMDTFAYRQPAWAAAIRVIEVDHPESQAFKRETLSKKGIRVPANVEFCPIDFEQTSLTEGLAKSSLDRSAAAFFSWLGVTQYLTRPAIDATLQFIAAMPNGSELVTEFILPPDQWSSDEQPFLKVVVEAVKELGEPWLTYFTSQELSNHLRATGFSQIRTLTPEEASARYFFNRCDGLRPSHYVQLMRASV
jgi:methyltransferase (TIGR00027 family)